MPLYLFQPLLLVLVRSRGCVAYVVMNPLLCDGIVIDKHGLHSWTSGILVVSPMHEIREELFCIPDLSMLRIGVKISRSREYLITVDVCVIVFKGQDIQLVQCM